MISSILKRDGRTVPFDKEKITQAIFKAAQELGGNDYEMASGLADDVVTDIEKEMGTDPPTVEQIQDTVERVLINSGHARTAKEFILYRSERSKARQMNTKLMKIYEDLTFKDASDNDIKRENANIDGDTAMGTMLKYGSEGAKQFYEMFILDPVHAKAHTSGDIHIHDLDFLTLTTTCTQIDLKALFKDGFCTGHGFLREPNDIQSYSALACIAIQSNQNDQHGGQSVPNFDYAMSDGVAKTYRKLYYRNLAKALEIMADDENAPQIVADIKDKAVLSPTLKPNEEYADWERQELLAHYSPEVIEKARDFTLGHTPAEADKATYQAMEALVHNLNTMHSRAGAQIPFSSLNYGTDISPEGRMVIKNVLLATDSGLGNGETAIFPIHVFKVKDGVSSNPGDPNYDLFKLACKVSAKRLFPNFSFLDAPFNLAYYKEGHPETEIAYMGCRTRVIGNVYDPTHEIVNGRGNLSFTSVNLPRLGIMANHNIELFFELLDQRLKLIADQLYARYKIQAQKKVRNFPFLMGQGIWLGSGELDEDDTIGEVLKHGTLSIGFIGLAECLKALIGEHHGESAKGQNMGLDIIGHMRAFCDKASQATQMNYSLIATPAEGLSGRFVGIDAKKFGVIPGVTDREYYTNSFHVPVYYKISAFEKIRKEAPYHALTNAGHISYVELDGDPLDNLDAFEQIVMFMKKCGIGYGSINHPVDRDPVCGYTGIIGDECPRCGRHEGEAVSVETLRKLGVNKYRNIQNCGVCGDINEEADRVPNSIQ